MNFLFRILYLPFNVLQKIYWFLWRKNQLSLFHKVGENVRISNGGFFHNEQISIGSNVYIGQSCRFQASLSQIIIGNNVMFGPEVSLHAGNHRTDIIGRFMIDITLDEKLPENDQDIIIKDDVWIGANAIILKGVTVGQGSIIGAGSIVSKSISPYSVVTGNKLQAIRTRWSEEKIKEHKKKVYDN